MYARTARKLERVQRHERAGAVKYLVGTNIERVPDDTTDTLTFVWRTREGDVFAEVHEYSDTHHDAIAVDVINDYEFQCLKRLDPDEYASRARLEWHKVRLTGPSAMISAAVSGQHSRSIRAREEP